MLQKSRKYLCCMVCVIGGLAPAGADSSAPPRNLLLISIDTLRADHLSCNGAQNVTTPNLDRLAREGVNFGRARTSVPLTLPSHASILTGNYPPTHGVRDNATSRLAESQLTLGEVLQTNGYETSAFLGSFVLDRRFGLAQGFDTYDDQVAGAPEELESLEAERSAEAVYTAFESWLSSRSSAAPFFAWLHFYDPHAPYAPPEPYATRYKSDPYVGEGAYGDEIVGRVLATLEEEDLLQQMVIALVGDHGEGLGEHGEHTHSLLIYNSTLHVPMMLFAPGLIEQGSRVDSLVRTIDLAPTLLELLGKPQDLGEGTSLVPLIARGIDSPTTQNDPGAVSYSESLYARLNLGWSPVRGLETETHRLILGPEPELYDVRADPGELRDLASTRPEIVSEMTDQLDRLIPDRDPADQNLKAPDLDPETVEQLRSLGYLTGSSTSGASSGEGSGVSPRENVAAWQQIEVGLRYYAQGDFSAAAQRFEAVLKTHPETPLLYEYLGSCYQRSGRNDEAETVYRKALNRGLESSEFHLGLARIFMARGDDRLAEKELLAAVDLDPLSVVGHHTLGDLYRRQKGFERAQEQYRTALEINPSYVYSWNGLGMTLGSLKDDSGALEAFRQAVKVAPESPLPHMNLAVQLEHMGRVDEAHSAYQEFLALANGRADLDRERALAEAALKRLES